MTEDKARELARDINAFQDNDHVHGLTCGIDSSHPNLAADVTVTNPADNFIVELICLHPGCSYRQRHIPAIDYKAMATYRSPFARD